MAVIITTFFLKNHQNPGNPLVWRAILFLTSQLFGYYIHFMASILFSKLGGKWGNKKSKMPVRFALLQYKIKSCSTNDSLQYF